VRLRFALFSLYLPLLSACPGDDEGANRTTVSTEATTSAGTSSGTAFTPTEDASGSASPDSDSGTSGPIAGCECIPDEWLDLAAVPPLPICGEDLCPYVFGTCGEGDGCASEAPPFEIFDPVALECALVALRDRIPGSVVWDLKESNLVRAGGYVVIQEDGTAVRRSWLRVGLDFEVSDAALGDLPPPAFFDACLAEPDDRARLECVGVALETELGVCREGWTCPDCI
jgi:hypothetical protein